MRRGEGKSDVGSESCFMSCGEIIFTWLPSSKRMGTGWSQIRIVEVRRCLR